MSELLNLAEWGVKRALELGADEAEVYVFTQTVRGVYSEGIRLRAVVSDSRSVQVRAAKGLRVAAAVATSASREVLEDAVRRAVEMAVKAEEDPHWRGLPDPEQPRHGWIGYDEGVTTVDVDWLAQLVKDAMAEAQRNPRLKVSSVGAGTAFGKRTLANSRGVAVEEKSTFSQISIALKSGESSGSSWISSRSLVHDYYPVLEEATRLAIDSSKAEKLGETLKGAVLFRARTLAMLLDALLVPALSAMNVLEGLSPLAGKLGRKVLGNLTIVDDGTLPGGLATQFFDGEGVARRRTALVERGVLKSYLHNTYTARRMGVESTGNASRGTGAVGISPSNLIVAGGECSEKDLEAEAKVVAEGYLLSVHTANPVTGNFSFVISNPYLVKGGDSIPVKPLAVSGNIYEVVELIKPARRIKDTAMGVYAPDTLIGGLTVTG